jgi:hypothetical protein
LLKSDGMTNVLFKLQVTISSKIVLKKYSSFVQRLFPATCGPMRTRKSLTSMSISFKQRKFLTINRSSIILYRLYRFHAPQTSHLSALFCSMKIRYGAPGRNTVRTISLIHKPGYSPARAVIKSTSLPSLPILVLLLWKSSRLFNDVQL